MAHKNVPENVAQYETAFRDLMEKLQFEGKASIKDRCRHLAFSIVDRRCPLHYYYDKSPGLTRVAYWVAEAKSPPKQVPHPVRDAVFQMSGRLGLLYTNGQHEQGQVKFRLQVPPAKEFDEICSIRLQLEAEGFKRIHLMDDQEKKQRVVRQLREANIEVKLVADKCQLISEAEWESQIATDALFAHRADEFYLKDLAFHMLPLNQSSLRFTADMLRLMLERARLTASDRLLILRRIPSSYEEHERLIDLVAEKPSRSTSPELHEELQLHVEKSKQHFADCLREEDGQE